MKRRILSIDELAQFAIADLGMMTDGSYGTFIRRATGIAYREKVIKPRLVLGLVYVDPVLSMTEAKEIPYLVAPDEWGAF